MPTPCRLYLITPPRLSDPAAFAKTLEAALGAGDVAALQIRLKDVDDPEIETAVRTLMSFAQAHDVAVILNDRPDLAARFGCDGVHIGQGDASYAEARRLMGKERIVGVTCHASRHLAMEAAEAGADYVAFGAFFDTATKAASTRADADILSIWQESTTTPCVAIGGITVRNCRALVTAGADFLAVSAGVWSYPEGPAAAVAAFNAEIAEGLKTRGWDDLGRRGEAGVRTAGRGALHLLRHTEPESLRQVPDPAAVGGRQPGSGGRHLR